MARTVQAGALMCAVAAVFFVLGAKFDTWFERPAQAAARSVTAAKPKPHGQAEAAKLAAPVPVAEVSASPESQVETGIDPDSNLEFYRMKNLPAVEGEGRDAQDVDMVDEAPASEPPQASAAPPEASATAN